MSIYDFTLDELENYLVDNGFKKYFRIYASIETNNYFPYNVLDIIKLYNESEYI